MSPGYLLVKLALESAKRYWISTNSGALEDQWGAQSAARDNDLLASPEDSWLVLFMGQRLRRDSLDTNGATTLHNDVFNLGVDGQV